MKKSLIMSVCAVFALLCAGGTMKYDSFRPGAEWLDTEGRPIQAHGGSIITVDGTYYWYDEKLFASFQKKNARHKEATQRARYVWLPIVFKGDRPTLVWRDEWKLEEFE